MAKKYKISGKRSGPPPLRGPNPNVPPVKMRYGGGADMGAPGRAQERADRGYGSVGSVQRDTGLERQRQTNISAQENKPSFTETVTNKINQFKIDPFGMVPGVSQIKMVGNILGPIAESITQGYLTKKAKGENILSRKVTFPSTRDYYKTTGKQLDVMSPEGKQYLQDDNRIPNFTQPVLGTGSSTNRTLCPDGVSMPPCPVVTAKDGKSIRVRGTKAAIRGTKFKGIF